MAEITACEIDFRCSDEWLSEVASEHASSIFRALGVDEDLNYRLYDDFRYDELEGHILNVIQKAVDTIDWDKALDAEQWREWIVSNAEYEEED